MTQTIFATPGLYTWNWPAGETKALVRCWGAGGGSGSSASGEGGGAGGSYSQKILTKGAESQFSVSVPVSRSAGGGAGGDAVVWIAGTPNVNVATASGGLGGSGRIGGGGPSGSSLGDIVFSGGAGGTSSGAGAGGGGGGAAGSPVGTGAAGGDNTGAVGGIAGAIPSRAGVSASGSGGAGADSGASAAAALGAGGGGGGGGESGAGGGSGAGRVEFYCPPPPIGLGLASGPTKCCGCTTEELTISDRITVEYTTPEDSLGIDATDPDIDLSHEECDGSTYSFSVPGEITEQISITGFDHSATLTRIEDPVAANAIINDTSTWPNHPIRLVLGPAAFTPLPAAADCCSLVFSYAENETATWLTGTPALALARDPYPFLQEAGAFYGYNVSYSQPLNPASAVVRCGLVYPPTSPPYVICGVTSVLSAPCTLYTCGINRYGLVLNYGNKVRGAICKIKVCPDGTYQLTFDVFTVGYLYTKTTTVACPDSCDDLETESYNPVGALLLSYSATGTIGGAAWTPTLLEAIVMNSAATQGGGHMLANVVISEWIDCPSGSVGSLWRVCCDGWAKPLSQAVRPRTWTMGVAAGTASVRL